MKIIATIEARMTSSRLPGKVLFHANNKPLLGHLVNRLKQVVSIDEIVLATTINHQDDVLVEFAKEYGISCYRGSEIDVLQRIVDAANTARADIVAQISGDCPLIDPVIVEQSIQMLLNNKQAVYLNSGKGYPGGIGFQVFYLDTLKKSVDIADSALSREHVGLSVRKNPELFSRVNLIAPPDLNWPELELVVDELEDYQFIKKLIEHFGDENPYFGCREIIQLLVERPDWISNQNIHRKGDT
jgi:spore coat polysaccharide biosynthesis protein SpsF